MQVKIKTEAGKVLTPEYFAVYTRIDGTVFKIAQDEISEHDLDAYPDIIKIDLYENGTADLSPQLKDFVAKH